MRELRAIWAQSRDGVIGDGSTLPWHVPEDLRHFKTTTHGAPVIMGRATWESLPDSFRPLPGRENIILSSKEPGEWSAGAHVVRSLDEVEGWIIGGGRVYAATLEDVTTVEVTLIDALLADSIDSPVFAPTLNDSFELEHESDWYTSKNGRVHGSSEPVRYRFLRYRRKD